MAEIALVSSRKPRLEAQANKGDTKAKAALKLANHPTFIKFKYHNSINTMRSFYEILN